MLTEFETTGAVLLRGVLTMQEVHSLRRVVMNAFESLDQRAGDRFVRGLSASMVLRIPELLAAITLPRIVATLREVLETNYALVPDFHLQRNMFDFTDTRRSLTHLFGLIGSGWHHDAGAEGSSPYLFAQDYRIVKCGLFLQDNTMEWGGGVDIAPGGHRVPLRTGKARLDYAALRMRQNFRVLTGAERVLLKAGDFLAFHAHLPHRGSPPLGLRNRITPIEKAAGCVRIPPENTKMVLYFNAARQKSALSYMRHSLKRGADELQRALAGETEEMFFSDFPGLRYPQNYPPTFAAALQENGLTMAQLEGRELECAVAIRDQALSSGRFNNVSLPAAHMATVLAAAMPS